MQLMTNNLQLHNCVTTSDTGSAARGTAVELLHAARVNN